ncbi:MAG: transporter substrate-binding protein [Haloplasmataceae bacterium]|jgi:ABC-type glycerol-3-phosphate transport system substrate-binding protein|nr:transporter substrate-binding protein [Haloplasmataceae bacterium]
MQKKCLYLAIFLILALLVVYLKPDKDTYAQDINTIQDSEVKTHIQQLDYLLNNNNFYKLNNNLKTPVHEIIINASNYALLTDGIPRYDDLGALENPYDDLDIEVLNNYEGLEGEALLTPSDGTVTWKFNVPEAGAYNIEIRYFTYPGNSADPEREIAINGEVPFTEMRNVTFQRIWGNDSKVEHINGKNDVRPPRNEKPFWQTKVLENEEGYFEPYFFELLAGENTISFTSIREPLLIDKIIVNKLEERITYEDYLAKYQSQKVVNEYVKVQAEDSTLQSSATLYPQVDRTSVRTEPFHRTQLRLNSIGGYNWRIVGDWIEWEVDVPKTGLYQLSMKVLQNFKSGSFSTRSLFIDGEIPFKEAAQIEIVYESDWQNLTLSNENGAFLFYLEEGTRKITLKNTLGRYESIIETVEQEIKTLNDLYREIIIFTSVSPDVYRDYQLEKRIENLEQKFQDSSDNLEFAIDKIVEITGEYSSNISVLQKTVIQLEMFVNDIRKVPVNLDAFKNNIVALGVWTMEAREQPLMIDFLVIHDDSYELKRAKSNIFEKLWYQLTTLFASFFVDYSLMDDGDKVTAGYEEITVWLQSTGRDQATIIKQLIDESFTHQAKVKVNIKLVNAGVLLPSTLAGVGPDVALFTGESLPVEYAMRNAIYDISQFEDFEEVKSRFTESAMTPYYHDGGYYGLPDSQNFMVMYYRTDILNELGIEPPKTWQEVIDIVPILQRNHLEFYIPQYEDLNALNPIFYSLLNQYGGKLYADDRTKTDLLTEESLDAFVDYTNFFSKYSFSIQANFVNRFRSGEMPIGIDYYTLYNSLSVFAPEIRGQWDFVPIPGTPQLDDDGNPIYVTNPETGKEEPLINNVTTSITSSTIMFKRNNNHEASWEFLKWWSSADTQVKYSRELEGIFGEAGRIATANLEALDQLSWPKKYHTILKEEIHNTVGIPVVPGSYITGRYINSAFRDSFNNSSNPRDMLYMYDRKINNEIQRKRDEFNLD